MDVTWLDAEDPDGPDLDGVTAVREAARQVDSPHELPLTTDIMRVRLRHGWDGEPPFVAAVRNGGPQVVALVELSMPERDNTHLGYVELIVDPHHRRQGIGRKAFDAAVERVRAAGRGLVMSESYDETPGPAFASSVGLEKATVAAKRRLDLLTVDWSSIDRLSQQAQEAAADYELVRLPRQTPPELLADLVEMVAAINDAPLDDLRLEDEVFSPERILAFQTAQAEHRRRLYDLAARHRATGKLVGHTQVAVESDLPHYAHQFDTSVLAAHRGHRLGLLLKTAMLGWLRESEPQLRTVDTWNAVSNAHMIAVNEALGCTLVTTASGFQREL